MTNILNKRLLQKSIIVFILVVIAVFLRKHTFENEILDLSAGLVRSLIYIGLFMSWLISIKKRIINKNQQNYLVIIASLIILWMVLRTIKYLFLVGQMDLTRYFWYSYYIPIMLIPIFSLYVALYLGKNEKYRITRWFYLLIPLSLTFIILVLTNDFHQLVFQFIGNKPYSDSFYVHYIGYYLIVSYTLIISLLSLLIIIKRARIAKSKRILWFPFIPMGLMFIYIFLYINKTPFIMEWLGDMNTVLCLLIIIIWESCIQSRLISSNTNYDRLFDHTTLAMQILDDNYQVHFTSKDIKDVKKSELISAQNNDLVILDNRKLSINKIKAGYAVWFEDVSELMCILNRLQESKTLLEDQNLVLEETYKYKVKTQRLKEQNRLYNLVHEQTKEHILLLNKLLNEFEQITDYEKQRSLLHQTIIIGAYLKRRNNLIFISEQKKTISINELHLCFKESFNNLELANVECGLTFDKTKFISSACAISIYDFFQDVIEESFDTIKAIYVVLTNDDQEWTCRIEIEAQSDFKKLLNKNIQIRKENKISYLTLKVNESM